MRFNPVPDVELDAAPFTERKTIMSETKMPTMPGPAFPTPAVPPAQPWPRDGKPMLPLGEARPPTPRPPHTGPDGPWKPLGDPSKR
jgi:hypothetical protein